MLLIRRIRVVVSAALLSGAVFSYAGPGIADGAAKFIGNITQSGTAPGPNDQFTKLWNQATAENGCKWGSVEGQRGKYNSWILRITRARGNRNTGAAISTTSGTVPR